jgi:transcription termination factor Rho
MIEGEVRTPKDGERYFALNKLDRVNGGGPEENKHKVMFENLTPLFPKEQMRWSVKSKAKRTSPDASSTSLRPSARASAP